MDDDHNDVYDDDNCNNDDNDNNKSKVSRYHISMYLMCVSFLYQGIKEDLLGEYMKDQLANNKPVYMPVMTREGDTAKMLATKILVERMTLSRAAHRCNITEACTALEREKGT